MKSTLSETASPEKLVSATCLPELQEVLERDFNTSYFPTVLDRIQLGSDGLIEFEDHQMPCAQTFLEAMAKQIAMPLDYAYAVDFELFRHNVEQRKERCSKAVTVCCNRGIAVNLAGAEYRPARTVDVLRKIESAALWQLRAAHVSDRGVEVSLIEPGRVTVMAPGDEIELGVRISNSETGFGSLKASLYSLRLVCTNGAVMADELGTARWNYDRRVAYLTSIDKFQKDLFKLRSRQDQQVQLYSDVLRRDLLDTELNNLWRRLRVSAPSPIVDAILGVTLEERQEFQHSIRDRRPGMPPASTDHTLWEVHNRITFAAQRFDFALRSRLERIGGSMLFQGSLN
jgi:hypothetical protein